tara:strand:+ start:5145 stop:7244 length:2100 start_codon:yes stop_codon:yes gene_type:complete
MSIKQHPFSLNLYITIISVIVFLTTLWGVYSHFSPVPYWDMWDGYLGFFLKASKGNRSIWIAQHNEHRILLSRLLFWLDLKYFKGVGVFLVCINILIQLGTAYVFVKVVSKRVKSDVYKTALYAFIFCLLFSWVQNDNFIWGFQSQFLFVYMFALLSFYYLGEYSNKKKKYHLALALFFACCSTYSMANGLLTFPLLILQALILRNSKLSIAAIVLTAIAISIIYFQNYNKPAGHSSIVESIVQHPFFVLRFMCAYLGSPFHPVLKSIHIATVAGGIFIFGAGACGYLIIKKRLLDSVNVTMCIFLLFILGTAFATATGRIKFGIYAATAGRYMTPALIGWVTLILLSFLNRASLPQFIFKCAKFALICMPALLLTRQVKAFEDFSETAFNRKVAVLGVAHHQYDKTYFDRVYPHHSRIVPTLNRSIDERLSVFASDWIKYNFEMISESSIPPDPCMGNIETTAPFQSGDSIAYRIRGWVWDPKTRTVPEVIILADEENNTVGYGISGEPRKEITKTVAGNPVNTGWVAYLLKSNVKGSISAYALTDSGLLRIPGAPVTFNETFKVTSISEWDGEKPSQYEIISNEWKKEALPPQNELKDVQKLFGSWVEGDAFMGKIELIINASDDAKNLIYATGPDSKLQDIEFFDMEGNSLSRFNLPNSKEGYTKLSLQWNTDQNIKIVISDNGNSWGQWSALLIP